MWKDVEVYCSWLQIDLQKKARKGKTSKEILQSLGDEAAKSVIHVKARKNVSQDYSRYMFIAAGIDRIIKIPNGLPFFTLLGNTPRYCLDIRYHVSSLFSGGSTSIWVANSQVTFYNVQCIHNKSGGYTVFYLQETIDESNDSKKEDGMKEEQNLDKFKFSCKMCKDIILGNRSSEKTRLD
ncbi:unnamed protein product [Lactuca saligna]|uniref:Uncharacterized protein n=1 Tax=Lactuca saligna TaxID=75948 RepID=A0AA35YD03_LACSI|nr:unnamed protein product [Lactuca saligna]